MTEPRKGDWMQTFSGRKFWPIDPLPAEVFIEDIAHALSLACRYGGHCIEFYSVAEHSVLMATKVHPENRLWALLHDASEAYIADIVRPAKRFITGYSEVEARIMASVCDRFGLDPTMPDEVHEVDNRILVDEIEQNLVPQPERWWDKYGQPLGVELRMWGSKYAEHKFLEAFYEYTR